MRSLGDALGVNLTRITDVYTWAMPMVNALNVSPVCDFDPACVSSRGDLQRIVASKDDGTLDKIAEVGRQLQGMQGTETLDEAVRGLGTSMDTARRPGSWAWTILAASRSSSPTRSKA
jgi:RND superfamily putative drug exporter